MDTGIMLSSYLLRENHTVRQLPNTWGPEVILALTEEYIAGERTLMIFRDGRTLAMRLGESLPSFFSRVEEFYSASTPRTTTLNIGGYHFRITHGAAADEARGFIRQVELLDDPCEDIMDFIEAIATELHPYGGDPWAYFADKLAEHRKEGKTHD